MKQRLLFVAGTLRLGGIERSLVNLLNTLDYSQFSVDLFLYAKIGDLVGELPMQVRCIEGPWLLRYAGNTMDEAFKSKNAVIIFWRQLLAIACRILGSPRVFKWIFSLVRLEREYDCAISFSNNISARSLYFGYNQLVLSKAKAKFKVAWIHSDYLEAGLNTKTNADEYRKFDAVVNVSNACKYAFDSALPEIRHRSFVVYNTFPGELILQRAQAGQNPFAGVKAPVLISVGRLDTNKSFDRVVKVADRLRNEGKIFYWFILGDGDQRRNLENLASALKVQDVVVFLGCQPNPYLYMRYADALVLTSQYEGMPMVVSEALILGVPVITTRYAAAAEQVQHGNTGYITDNSDEGLYQGLKQVLTENELARLKGNLKSIIHTNEVALSQFQRVIENLGS